MANQMDKRIENTDNTTRQEDTLTSTQARQGNSGRRILIILFVALFLIILAYLPIWLNSSRTIDKVESQLPGQQMQSQTPEPPSTTAPDAQTTDVPTVTPNTTAPAENVNPAPQPAVPAPGETAPAPAAPAPAAPATP